MTSTSVKERFQVKGRNHATQNSDGTANALAMSQRVQPTAGQMTGKTKQHHLKKCALVVEQRMTTPHAFAVGHRCTQVMHF